jgi:hypothetical protein
MGNVYNFKDIAMDEIGELSEPKFVIFVIHWRTNPDKFIYKEDKEMLLLRTWMWSHPWCIQITSCNIASMSMDLHSSEQFEPFPR